MRTMISNRWTLRAAAAVLGAGLLLGESALPVAADEAAGEGIPVEVKKSAQLDPDNPQAIRGPRPPRPRKWGNKKTKLDKDADGIPDSMEVPNFNFAGFPVNLSPTKKDILLVIDVVGTDGANNPTMAAINLFIQSMANGAVFGANRKSENQGLNVHVIFLNPVGGFPAPSNSDVGQFIGNDMDWSDLDLVKNHLLQTRLPALNSTPKIWYYCLSCHSYAGTGSSGIARVVPSPFSAFRRGGVDHILSLQGNQSDPGLAGPVAGTIMHELGHTLGLTHGGFDHVNYKPNYVSIMNYHFQFFGVIYGGNAVYDYSRIKVPPLNENKLKEKKGIGKKAAGVGTRFIGFGGPIVVPDGSQPIDWNENAQIDPKPVPESLNFPFDNDLTWLVSEENWSNINWTSGGQKPVAGNALPVAGDGDALAGISLVSDGNRLVPTAPVPNYAGRFLPMSEDAQCQPFTAEMAAQVRANAAQRKLAESLSRAHPNIRFQTSGCGNATLASWTTEGN